MLSISCLFRRGGTNRLNKISRFETIVLHNTQKPTCSLLCVRIKCFCGTVRSFATRTFVYDSRRRMNRWLMNVVNNLIEFTYALV